MYVSQIYFIQKKQNDGAQLFFKNIKYISSVTLHLTKYSGTHNLC